MRKMIVAMLTSGIIGNKGAKELLWHIPEELKFFKEQTQGQVVVFGKNTFLSLPKVPLPNRINVVLTDKPLEVVPEGVVQVFSIEELNEKYPDYIVCGGGSVYDALAPYVDELIATTIIGKEFEHLHGDLKFTAFDKDEYRIVELEVLKETKQFISKRYKVIRKLEGNRNV